MTPDQLRARSGLDALSNLEAALGDLRKLTVGLHIPGVDAALERAWRSLGATEYALRELAGEPGVQQDQESWAAGYASAYERAGAIRMPPGLDGLSWSSGRIEGEADRLAGRPSKLDPPAETPPAPGM